MSSFDQVGSTVLVRRRWIWFGCRLFTISYRPLNSNEAAR